MSGGGKLASITRTDALLARISEVLGEPTPPHEVEDEGRDLHVDPANPDEFDEALSAAGAEFLRNFVHPGRYDAINDVLRRLTDPPPGSSAEERRILHEAHSTLLAVLKADRPDSPPIDVHQVEALCEQLRRLGQDARFDVADQAARLIEHFLPRALR